MKPPPVLKEQITDVRMSRCDKKNTQNTSQQNEHIGTKNKKKQK